LFKNSLELKIKDVFQGKPTAVETMDANNHFKNQFKIQ
jgi:hypothetical protein